MPFLSFAQDTIGVYYNVDIIKVGKSRGPSFTTKLILKSDSTFEYTFKGDLFYDSAIGTYYETNRILNLKYITPDYEIVKTSFNDSICNELPYKNESVLKWKNPSAHLRPTQLLLKRKKIIVLKTKENRNYTKKLILKKTEWFQRKELKYLSHYF